MSSVTLSFAIYIDKASSIELLTLRHEPAPSDDITLSLDGPVLKMRADDNDVGQIAVPLGAWHTILFTATAAQGTLVRTSAGAGNTTDTKPQMKLRTQVNGFILGAGVWYKQGEGDVDVALDDVSIAVTR